MELLQTKLYVPPLRPEWVPRPRLGERFKVELQSKLTLVSVPAGFGETTMVSEGLRSSQIPIGWVSLVKAGADSKSIIVSKPQGAHPGGTVAMGKVMDEDMQTKLDNLFVCDASVFPAATGMPLILTISALAKRLAKTLAPQ